MTGDRETARWEQVESLFHAALQRPPAERDDFLRDACRDDPALRDDVASLLTNAGDEPPLAWAATAAFRLIAEPAALEPGQHVGPYTIVSFIASGGMGAVYRAHDPRMGRDVAIKVSAEQFSDRFAREVHAVASLNHPNVAAIYDVGPNYLVLELVNGETLAERIRGRGALPVEEALDVARQIAEGLEAAHERGIVHRDLKPGNVKITPAGGVKILDFGLAKLPASRDGFTHDAAGSAGTAASTAGMIVGTAAYMAPEQARGAPVDRRADVWAYGVVLFEMLAGRPLYSGELPTDIVAAVIAKEPEVSALPADVPLRIRELIELCLRRDPRQRLRDIGDARILIERYISAPRSVDGAGYQSRRSGIARWVAWGAMTAVGAAVVAGIFLYFTAPGDEQRLLTLSLTAPEDGSFFEGIPPALSPDGQRIAFVADQAGRRRLFVRDLASSTPRVIADGENTGLPFWSPDGRFIGFFADGKLKVIDSSGSAPAVTLCDADQLRGGSWGSRAIIVFGTGDGGLRQVPAAGGPCTAATALDVTQAELRHGFPWFLPDGRHFLFTALSQDASKSGVYVAEVGSSRRTRILATDSNAIYAEPGNLLYVRDGTLVAQPFDTVSQTVRGDATPIVEGLDFNPGRGQPRYRFAASNTGVLAYIADPSDERNARLTIYDRSGNGVDTIAAPARAGSGAFSPEGRTVAYDKGDPSNPLATDIWLYDLARRDNSRLTANGRLNNSPLWSPDGRFIIFGSGRAGSSSQIVRLPVAGSGNEEVLGPNLGRPTDWSPDGRFVLTSARGTGVNDDIWVVPLPGRPPSTASAANSSVCPESVNGLKPFPYLQTQFDESMARFSPDCRWVAYHSDDTSRREVYVSSFPLPGRRKKVSLNGGDRPVWSHRGDELFFVGADATIMAVTVRQGGNDLDVSAPTALFKVPIQGRLRFRRSWVDVSRHGLFLVPTDVESATAAPMTVVVNWTQLIRR
jgi:serine/threonine protein kinase/Tol biopolymer transport system component